MDLKELKETIETMIAPLLQEECAELFEIRINQTPRGLGLVILVDLKEARITLDICARLNRRIGDLIESRGILDGNYFLEVSSPGVDRELKARIDFSRCIGERVRFFLNEAIDGKVEWDGIVRAAGDESVQVEVKGNPLVVPYVKINKAKLIL